MKEGALTISLKPSCISFSTSIGGQPVRYSRDCTAEEIRSVLDLLNVERHYNWPPEDCIMHVRGQFPKKLLAALGLVRDDLYYGTS